MLFVGWWLTVALEHASRFIPTTVILHSPPWRSLSLETWIWKYLNRLQSQHSNASLLISTIYIWFEQNYRFHLYLCWNAYLSYCFTFWHLNLINTMTSFVGCLQQHKYASPQTTPRTPKKHSHKSKIRLISWLAWSSWASPRLRASKAEVLAKQEVLERWATRSSHFTFFYTLILHSSIHIGMIFLFIITR